MRAVITVATWNVNSIKQREMACAQWLRRAAPDILCLQELKCTNEGFPRSAFEELGYNCAVLGQKSFNGVAILSKFPIDETVAGLPGDPGDEQARYIETVISLPGGKAIRVSSIYAPNGNPAPSPKLDYKLEWFRRLKTHTESLLAYEEPVVSVRGNITGMEERNLIPADRACRRRPSARRQRNAVILVAVSSDPHDQIAVGVQDGNAELVGLWSEGPREVVQRKPRRAPANAAGGDLEGA